MSLKAFQTYRAVLSANGERTIDSDGNFFAVLSATGPFSLALDDEPWAQWQEGLGHKPVIGEQFNRVRLLDRSGGPNTIEISIGFGEIADNRLVVSAPITLSKAGTLASTADVALTAATATIIVAANANRRRVAITNLATNTAVIRIGESVVAAARGTPIYPGETLPLDTEAAVYGYSVPGESVAVLELRD